MRFGKHLFVFLLTIGLLAGCYAMSTGKTIMPVKEPNKSIDAEFERERQKVIQFQTLRKQLEGLKKQKVELDKKIAELEKAIKEGRVEKINPPGEVDPGFRVDRRLGIPRDPLIKDRLGIKPPPSRNVVLEIRKAISSGDLAKVKELIETGKFSVNQSINMNIMEEGWMGIPPFPHTSYTLNEAARLNKFDIVKYLVEKGADVNSKDISEGGEGRRGWIMSALDYAKQNNNAEMIKFLQDHGAK